MRIYPPFKGVLLAVLFLLPVALSAASKSKARRNTEYMLLRGVQFYEQNDMESAMESFMEVMRMGGTAEESAMARNYLERINMRMAGHSAADIPATSTSSPHAISGYLPSIKTDMDYKSEPARKSRLESTDDSPAQAAPEVLEEYVERQYKANRSRLLDLIKKKERTGVLSKDSDKFLALSIDDGLVFSQNTDFQKESGELLGILTEILYFHPRHMIRIYPAWTNGKSAIQDLQRAAVLGSYLSTQGLASERIKVELEKTPQSAQAQKQARDWEAMLSSRDRRILLYFEEYTQPVDLNNFFTRFMSRPGTVKGQPIISLGVSREMIDTSKEEGAAVEFFVNGNPEPVAQWRLLLKNDSGGLIMSKEGTGAAIESIYFDGRLRQGDLYTFLPAGNYILEAEAVSAAGAKVRAASEIEIKGGGLASAAQAEPKAEPAEPKEVSAAKKPVLKTAKKSVSKAAKKAVKKAAPKAAVKAPQADEDAAPKEDAPHAKVPERMLQGEVLTYKITFLKDGASISNNQAETLSQISSAAKTYPQQRFSIIGLAGPEEKDSSKLAEERARIVAKALSSKYGISSNRLTVDSGVGSQGQREVEISIEE